MTGQPRGLPLTVFSQTDEQASDLSVFTIQKTDPDLPGWTPVDSPDTRHETADQKGTQLHGGAAAPDPADGVLAASSHLRVLRRRGKGFPPAPPSLEAAAARTEEVLRACEYELAGIGRALGRVLSGWYLAAPGDSLRA